MLKLIFCVICLGYGIYWVSNKIAQLFNLVNKYEQYEHTLDKGE